MYVLKASLVKQHKNIPSPEIVVIKTAMIDTVPISPGPGASTAGTAVGAVQREAVRRAREAAGVRRETPALARRPARGCLAAHDGDHLRHIASPQVLFI